MIEWRESDPRRGGEGERKLILCCVICFAEKYTFVMQTWSSSTSEKLPNPFISMSFIEVAHDDLTILPN